MATSPSAATTWTAPSDVYKRQGQRSRSLLWGFKEYAELFNGKGVAAHPLGCVPQNGKAASVGLARVGAVILCCPGSGQRYACLLYTSALLRQSRFLLPLSRRTGEHDCASPAVAPQGASRRRLLIFAQASRAGRSPASDAPQFSKR